MLRSVLRVATYALPACALLTLALALGGCGPGNGWATLIAGALSLAGLILAGCSSSHVPGADGAVDGAVPDAAADAGGSWESCCESGRVSTCFCPAGWACNYGWYTHCGDGTCVSGPGQLCPGQDGGTDAGPDAGGTWDPCCVDGTITTCFCPGGAECNYGWYTDCGGGTCVNEPSACPVPDAGVDAGGYWEPCCVDGAITTCFCPAGLACNYGWFTDCGNNVCVGPTETCPAAPP